MSTGEVIRLNNHRLMNGDATNKDDVSELIGDCKVDLLLTDPPYGISIVNIERESIGAIGGAKPPTFKGRNSRNTCKTRIQERERANDKNRKGGCPWRCTAKTL